MALVLDTSFLVALNSKADINHAKAQSLKQRLKNREFGQIFISDYIFDEFATFLMAKSFPPAIIREIGDSLLAEESIGLLKISPEVFLKSWELFKKMKSISFTDCTTLVLSSETGIKNIASFDADFDRFPGVKRITD